MTIELFNHRGDHVADTFKMELVHAPRVGDFIKRPHPGFGGAVRLWHVVDVTHDINELGAEVVVKAWEISEAAAKATAETRHGAALWEQT
jgi:hypothetical protein